MARKIKRKLTKEQKSLLISMLIGDGTITNHPDYKLSHSESQREFLEWKIKLLEKYGFEHGGLKEYISKCGYNLGNKVLYVRIKTNPTIKALRRSVYKPKKTFTRNLLNWLNPLGLAIWYMDDGCINVNTSIQRSSIQHTCKIATCVDEETINMMITYFKEIWNINFRPFKEGKNTYSLATSSEQDCINFVNIIKPYVEQVPSLLYKIRDNFTKEEFIAYQKTDNFRSARHIIGN